jgi:hypothetical protein
VRVESDGTFLADWVNEQWNPDDEGSRKEADCGTFLDGVSHTGSDGRHFPAAATWSAISFAFSARF